MNHREDKPINKKAIYRSLKIALVYSFLFIIGLIYFKEPIFNQLKLFLKHGDILGHSWMYCGVFFSFGLCHLINAYSWMILLQRQEDFNYWINLKGAMVYSMLINVLPIGTGHMLGIWFFNKCSKISVRRLLFGWSVDQYTRGVIKVVFLILFLNLANPFGEITDKLREALFYFGFLILIVALAIPFIKKSLRIQTTWLKICEKFNLKKEEGPKEEWGRTFLRACCLRALCWVFEIWPVWLLCDTLLVNYELELVFSLFLSVKVATAYSFSPGNFGVHEAVAYFVATAYGVDEVKALSLGVLYHLGFWLPTVLPGFLVLIKQSLKIKPYLEDKNV